MALLALVAAAGRRGITRERVLAILWPDSEEEPARHILSQNLYSLRRETGRDWIVANPELRLDPSITADVADFQEAIAANDLGRAAALYTGPFLDGFSLPRAPEFDRWVEGERGRFQAAATRAMETLANRVPNPLEADAGPAIAQPAVAARVPAPRRRGLLAGGIVAGVAAIGLVGRILLPSTAPSPFLAVGMIRGPDSIAPGAILRDMLATNLGSISGLQVVANSRLLELMPPRADSAGTATTDAAGRAGATEVIEGEVSADRDGLTLTLRRLALPSGVIRQGYTVRAADRYGLIDSAAAAIARDLRLTPPSKAIAEVMTNSATAYALYEEGLRAFYQSDLPAAHRLMSAALQRDSTFAMAAYHVWVVSRLAGLENDSARELVKRLASRTVDRERLLIQGAVAEYEAPVTEQLAIAREMTARFPHDPDGQMLLGAAYSAFGDWGASVAAYDQVVAIDSAAGAAGRSFCRVCKALHAMATSYAWWDSTAAAERCGRRLMALRPEEGYGGGLLVEPLLRQGRRVEAESVIVKASGMSLTKGDFGPTLDRDLIRWGRFEELDVKLLSDLRSTAPGEGRWLLTLSLRNQGRLREATALAREGLVPKTSMRLSGPPDAISLAIIPLEMGRPQESARRFRELAAGDAALDAPPGFKARILTWHLTLAGTAQAAAGDTAGVRRLADSVQRIGQGSRFGRDLWLHHFLRGLILQRQQRHREAVDAFRLAMFSTTEGYTRINLELARSLMAVGRAEEAVAVLRPALRGGVDGSNTFVTHTELREALAQAFDLAGNRDSAAVHFRAVERAWRWADPEFSDRYLAARQRMEVR